MLPDPLAEINLGVRIDRVGRCKRHRRRAGWGVSAPRCRKKIRHRQHPRLGLGSFTRLFRSGEDQLPSAGTVDGDERTAGTGVLEHPIDDILFVQIIHRVTSAPS
jgi:hypothetical protein